VLHEYTSLLIFWLISFIKRTIQTRIQTWTRLSYRVRIRFGSHSPYQMRIRVVLALIEFRFGLYTNLIRIQSVYNPNCCGTVWGDNASTESKIQKLHRGELLSKFLPWNIVSLMTLW